MTIYNEVTKRVSEALMNEPPHALLVSGPVGVGLTGIWQSLLVKPGEQQIQVLPEKDEKVDLEKGTLTIGVIRKLYDVLRTTEPKGRVVIIDQVERMGIPAQNAFLKLLEEPSPGTRFILATHSPELLLPTIRSRVQHIEARPVSLEQSNTLLDELAVTDPARRAQLLFIAKGLPAELSRLVEDDGYFAQRAEIVKDARAFITESPYTRLLLAKKYKDSREKALLLVSDSLKQLRQTLASGGPTDTLGVIERLVQAHKRLTEQGNVRLQLSALAMLQYK